MSTKFSAYYSEDVVIDLPTGTLNGKTGVRDNFVRPFITGFPGDVHSIKNLAMLKVWSRWNGILKPCIKDPLPTSRLRAKKFRFPGCSFYEYDLGTRTIPAGRIYFDFVTPFTADWGRSVGRID